jgi:hypothetical protein
MAEHDPAEFESMAVGQGWDLNDGDVRLDAAPAYRLFSCAADPVNRKDPLGLYETPTGTPTEPTTGVGTRLMQLGAILALDVLALEPFAAQWEFQYRLQHAPPQPAVDVNPTELPDFLVKEAADRRRARTRKLSVISRQTGSGRN